MQNLVAEMARYGISVADMKNILSCSEKTVRNKLVGLTEFSVGDAMKVRDTFFAGMTIEYLFASSEPIRDTGQQTDAGQQGA